MLKFNFYIRKKISKNKQNKKNLKNDQVDISWPCFDPKGDKGRPGWEAPRGATTRKGVSLISYPTPLQKISIGVAN